MALEVAVGAVVVAEEEVVEVAVGAVVVALHIGGSPLRRPIELRPRLRPVWPIAALLFYR